MADKFLICIQSDASSAYIFLTFRFLYASKKKIIKKKLTHSLTHT